MNYTYIVKCADGSLYTGWTTDINKRIKKHNEGKGAKYTRTRIPVELVYYEVYDTKKEAMSREWHIKRLSRRDKFQLIKKQNMEADNMNNINRKNSYPAIDMHCDTIMLLKYKEDAALRSNDLHIDLLRMKEAGYMCQCFAMFTPLDAAKKYGTPFEYLTKLNEVWDREISANGDLIRPALTASDIENNYKNGFMSAVKTVEEAAVFEGNPDLLKEMYDKGVRMSNLTWNFENEYAFPNYVFWIDEEGKKHSSAEEGFPDTRNAKISDLWFEPDRDRGLKPLGKELISMMEDLGILIDTSHLNDAGIFDIFDITGKHTPIIASHSNAREVMNHSRNLSDEMIRRIAERGGICGMNYCADFMNARKDNLTTCEDIIKHMQHMKNVGGIECIGLGSDFDGIENKLEFGGCEGVGAIAEAMDKAGFTPEETEKVFYKNFLRVFKEVCG